MTTPPPEEARLPWPVVPMLPKLVRDVPPDDERWGFEVKWDGIRATARVEAGALTLMTRNLIDATGRYPELGVLPAALDARTAVLDGEVVGFDEHGRATFEALRRRTGDDRTRPAQTAGDPRLAYIVFDVLYLDGRSLLSQPYEERRALLAGLDLNGGHWRVPPHSLGGGREMLELSRAQGLEGMIAKRFGSPYEPGKRSSAWLKIKNQQRQEFVIGGWVPGAGKRTGTIGALIIGYREGDQFVSAGKVGTGFTDAMLRELEERLRPLSRTSSPFASGVVPREAQHVEPRLVCEVEFTEWTSASGQLRHASFKGLRTDKSPKDVVRETPA